jgi:surface carbohydrate biosynthesis protein (TIGR04326 family)
VTAAGAMLVWDQKGEPPLLPGQVLCWQSYLQGHGVASVPHYLEVHAERIRSRYLAFVHDLGASLVDGRQVVEHLDTGEGFSFWWMTTIAEKSPLKSPRIYDCLRMLALEEMLVASLPASLTLVSADSALAEAMRATCGHLKIGFSWQRRGAGSGWSLRKLYECLPYTLKALLSLRHVAMRWPLRKLRNAPWFTGDTAILICSYFIHMDPALSARGQFHSRQWEDLPQMLHDSGRPLNWLQLFLFSAAVPDVGTGVSWAQHFNADARHQGCHAFVDSFLSLPLVLRVLRRWLWLRAVGRRLKNISHAFRPRESALWLWPLLRDDWWLSLNGQIGMANCLAVAQFDAALAAIPRQTTGLYLCENQAWEKALLRAWRKHGHGNIIGVQHATAPFWHLYYLDDPRSLVARQRCALPLPDRMAVNGATVWKALRACGYPEDRLVQAEALRYLDLAQLAGRRGSNGRAADAGSPEASEQRQLKVLVLGDLIPTSVHHLLGMLESAMALLPPRFDLTFKPHPGYAVDLAQYPRLLAGHTQKPLAQLLAGFDAAVVANSTSAAVDAYVAGLPVIIALDGDELNLSPLRGQPGVRFVTTAAQLADALRSSNGVGVATDADRDEFFFLDPQLPRWKRLVSRETGG